MTRNEEPMPRAIDFTDADIEGILMCYCGCKYWDDLRCHDCGLDILVTPELLYVAFHLVRKEAV